MKRTSKRSVVAILLSLSTALAQADVTATRELEEGFDVAAVAALEVVVHDVFGSVHVTGGDGTRVEMTATETIRADNDAELARARSEVRLATRREDGRIAFVVESDDGCPGRGWCWDDYTVSYDIELSVPRDAAVDIATVNGGEVVIDGVRGRFRAANVNGSIALSGLESAGHAQTVNGTIAAEFARAPTGDSRFDTVNGDIDLSFSTDLSADLQWKTLHGDLWTDFETTGLAAEPTQRRRVDGRLVIEVDRHSAVRVGDGGPIYTMETLNGEIYVRRAR